MYISYKWSSKYDSKSAEFSGMSIERILNYELEATFTIESDDDQKFTEEFVPIYTIAKALKESKFNDVDINLDGWGYNPFLSIKRQDSKIRVKNSFIDFECSKDVYELETDQFIFLVEKDIRAMGFNY